MIQLALKSNPILKSQERLVLESQELPVPSSKFAVSGINFDAGAAFWNSETNSLGFVPSITLGLDLSIGNPSRTLNILELKKERARAKQDYQEIKNSIVSDLLSYVREVLTLKSQRKSLMELRIYLEDYSDLTEKQVKAGVEVPEPDKLWELKERQMGIDVELQDVKNQLSTIRLEAAMKLGGESWEELLALFWLLDGEI
jgi:hypothetical protein